ncbi:DUF2335 domain-containing protein [Mycolicibacterium smegmatis]|uniref:DUF2335 domain-containing protein n=1 Tax=Mycolicibacterium smegmatis TaxID=1772 RepID=UPI003A0FBE06
MPPPKALREYEEICPGAADRVLRMAMGCSAGDSRTAKRGEPPKRSGCCSRSACGCRCRPSRHCCHGPCAPTDHWRRPRAATTLGTSRAPSTQPGCRWRSQSPCTGRTRPRVCR